MLSALSLLATALPLSFASPLNDRAVVSPNVATCNKIQSVISSASVVSWPGSATYITDNTHWVPNVETNGTCTVQPGTPQDVAAIFEVLGSSTTPFAVKGGGHTSSPQFSSSSGVTIVMKRFSEVVYHPNNATVDIGSGGVWEDVYEVLDEFGVTVMGGRIQGVGIGGFSLGGGYAWQSNQYGLTIDNIVAYELVTPTGSILEVNAYSYPDLYWALKGGFLNYGIVTKFTFKAIAQGATWGGLINYPASSIPAVEKAVADWAANVTDPDGEIVVAFVGQNGTLTSTVLAFYNAPAPPKKNNPFSELLAIPQTSNTLATRNYYEQVLALSPPYENPNNMRGGFGAPRVGNITLPIIQTAVKQVQELTLNPMEPDAIYTAGLEPFIAKNLLKPLSAGLWPHETLFCPTAVGAFWNDPANDVKGYNAIASMNAAMNVTASSEYDTSGIYLYPNYEIKGQATLEGMYGPNLARAIQIAAKYDPKKVMTRAGGFIFQSA